MTGELGYAIWYAPDVQRQPFDALCEVGVDQGLRPFDARALDSLRLEKGFGAFLHSRDRTPFETSLERLVEFDKGHFVSREAPLQLRATPPARGILWFAVDVEDADRCGAEPVLADGVPVGRVTSGGFGHTVGRSLAPLSLRSPLGKRRRPRPLTSSACRAGRNSYAGRCAICKACACGAEA